MDRLFSNWDTADSYAILAITLIAFLFGLLIGYLLRTPTIRRLREELEKAKLKVVAAGQEVEKMKQQFDQKEADVQKATYDLVEVAERADLLEQEKAKLLKEVFHTNQEIEKLQATNRTYLSTIEDLNDQIAQFEEAEDFETGFHDAAGDGSDSGEQTSDTSESGDGIPAETEILEETRLRMERFEAKLSQLEHENQALKDQIDNLHPVPEVQAGKNTAPDSSSLVFEIDEEESEPEVGSDVTQKRIYQKIIVSDIEKDDLTRIDGIGPFLQTKLHEMGVYTYAEIAGWESDRITEITEQIGYFPGRIEKDDWVGQARELYELKQTQPGAFAPKPPAKPDDLKVVEGIGPKIEQLLKNAGIQTWAELAETQLERLYDILAEAGEHYRIHDPGTWAEQARLAAEEKWDELKSLKEELKGGRKVK